MNTVLVTGGAGFIGSHVVDALRGRGCVVGIVDDFNDYYDPEIKRANVSRGVVKVYEGDLRDRSFCDKTMSDFKPDAVIHLAARAGVRPSLQNPQLYVDTNLNGTLNLMDAMRQMGIGRMLFASSSSVYGNNRKVPFAEGDALESLISPYAVTKHAGEQICKIYTDLYGMEITALRFFTVYGPRQRPDLAISKFVRHVHEGLPIDMYGDGSTSRDYTYVGDIVSGVLAALDRLTSGYRVYNLGGEHPVSLAELIRVIEAVVGRAAVINQMPLQPGDVERTAADLSRAKADLDYQPLVSISEGVQAYYKWWLAVSSSTQRGLSA